MSFGKCIYSIYFFSFAPMIAPSETQRHSTQPKLVIRLTISLPGTISAVRLLHILGSHQAMRCQRPPAKHCNHHKRTDSLRSELVYSFWLFLKHSPEPAHDRAMCGHPTRLSTRQERVKARDEWCGPEIHCGPPSREELRRGPEGVAERREHT